ncbi:hypothetical protein EJ08DRAFT_30477 [Tothia fuscella]|uniref:Uncharacterized protein n=1 Tax=Tothia fuscella TaxID=1048955 RepID=A0A9P4NGH3_9PEZI|nr:hypothetical protein EJ08DRAFT_30477 [Tothia fuscella]
MTKHTRTHGTQKLVQHVNHEIGGRALTPSTANTKPKTRSLLMTNEVESKFKFEKGARPRSLVISRGQKKDKSSKYWRLYHRQIHTWDPNVPNRKVGDGRAHIKKEAGNFGPITDRRTFIALGRFLSSYSKKNNLVLPGTREAATLQRHQIDCGQD